MRLWTVLLVLIVLVSGDAIWLNVLMYLMGTAVVLYTNAARLAHD